MTVDPQHDIRGRLTNVLLALQLIAHRPRPWDQQQRLARIGIAEARRLAGMVLNGDDDARPSQTRQGAT
jgi:hypothetical protein